MCKYCGKDAGFFSHEHKECEEKHSQGVSTFEDGVRKYLKDVLKINDLIGLVALLVCDERNVVYLSLKGCCFQSLRSAFDLTDSTLALGILGKNVIPVIRST